jgi:hypothetical protein
MGRLPPQAKASPKSSLRQESGFSRMSFAGPLNIIIAAVRLGMGRSHKGMSHSKEEES